MSYQNYWAHTSTIEIGHKNNEILFWVTLLASRSYLFTTNPKKINLQLTSSLFIHIIAHWCKDAILAYMNGHCSLRLHFSEIVFTETLVSDHKYMDLLLLQTVSSDNNDWMCKMICLYSRRVLRTWEQAQRTISGKHRMYYLLALARVKMMKKSG